MARKRLGELLLEQKAVTGDQLAEALAYQRTKGLRLGHALVVKGFLTEQALCEVLGRALGIPVVDLEKLSPDFDALQLLRPRFCEAHELIPIGLTRDKKHKTVTVAMADPLNVPAIEEIEFTTHHAVKPVLAGMSQVHAAIRKHYYKIGPRPGIDPNTMVVIRPGGKEDVVPDDAPEELADENILPLTEEITGRHALAEIMKEREQRSRGPRKKQRGTIDADLNFLFGVQDASEGERLEILERRFWALLRLMAQKGLITSEEFNAELDD
jgi:hypothetical protein